MSNIYVRTYAFNAEKTLPRTIESILNQTHPDFFYYICDNGSTDGTRSIVEHYARQDKRIRPFYNEINGSHEKTEECLLLPYHIGANDFYCTIDADDEYKPEYLDRMLEFIEEYNLDIAACGNDILNVTQNNKMVGQRKLSRSMIVQGIEFAKLFPIYHVFMRTVWGKLYKGWTLSHTCQRADAPGFPKAYGGDTYNTMKAFSSANRVGILAQSLHKYYVSPKSVSYQYNKHRPETDQILHKAALEYLKPYGEISIENQAFLLSVYMNALRDTSNVIINAKISVSEKLDALHKIYACEYTKQLAAWDNLDLFLGREAELQNYKINLFASLVQYLVSFKEIPDEYVPDYCEMGEFFSAAAGLADEWIFFKKLFAEYLITQMRLPEAQIKLNELKELLPDNADIMALEKVLNLQKF